MGPEEIEIGLADLHKSLRDLAQGARNSARPRLRFVDGNDVYRMLLQENNLGFNVSGTLNGAVAYQLNTTIFSKAAEIGAVVLQIAAAPADTTVEEFFR